MVALHGNGGSTLGRGRLREVLIHTQRVPHEGASDRRRDGKAVDVRPVALTFDDGPDPLWTPRVLEAFDRAGARATFFVMPPVAVEHEAIVRDALDAGHGVELHCARHVRHTELSPQEVEGEAREGLRVLRSLGAEPRLWRPPWGVVAPWTWGIAAEHGLEVTGWTADTHDWRGDGAEEMLSNIEHLLEGGAVVLMHDGLGPGARRDGCEETVALVEVLVSRLREKGLEPSPVRAGSNSKESARR